MAPVKGWKRPMTDAGFGDEVPEVELQDCGPPSQDRELDLSARTGFCRVAWRGSSTVAAPGPRVLACFFKSSRSWTRRLTGSGTVVDEQRRHGSMTLAMDWTARLARLDQTSDMLWSQRDREASCPTRRS